MTLFAVLVIIGLVNFGWLAKIFGAEPVDTNVPTKIYVEQDFEFEKKVNVRTSTSGAGHRTVEYNTPQDEYIPF
jgi:hypothetical protein